MSPIEHYKNYLASGDIIADPDQEKVINKLDQLYSQLISNKKSFLSFVFKKSSAPKGIYLWGTVGAGKTFLIDIFYNALPSQNKWRIHFHKFMQQIHAKLKKLQGIRNPLQQIATELAKQYRIICLDELLVTNIVDAMILGELFKALYAEKICLCFTSNTAPENLYKHGLQRQQFLPAIDLIKHHSDILHLNAQVDYRLQYQENANYYWTPLNQVNQKKLEDMFMRLVGNNEVTHQSLQIHHREIPVIKQAKDIIWFDFLSICDIPRSQEDFLTLAEKYHTVLISELMPIASHQHDLIQNFIKLVDVFYDARVKLIITAAVPIHDIYKEGKMGMEFARTKSRLIEMQSDNWTSQNNVIP